jgi:hypothetical protein
MTNHTTLLNSVYIALTFWSRRAQREAWVRNPSRVAVRLLSFERLVTSLGFRVVVFVSGKDMPIISLNFV